jgi:hypothetical protein
MGFTVINKAAPSQSNDTLPLIAQYATSFDQQLASKYLLVGDGAFTNPTTALFIDVDGTLAVVAGPNLPVDGQNRVAGCPLDATKALIVWPADGPAATAAAYYFDWIAKTFSAATAPPAAPNGVQYVAVSLGGGKALCVFGTTAYVFDMAGNGGLGSWTATATNPSVAAKNFGILLPNGKALIGSADIYDPVGNAWSVATSAPALSPFPGFLLKLHSGKIAGFSGIGGGTLFLFDPTTGAWDAGALLDASGVLITGIANGMNAYEYAANKLLLLNVDGAGAAFTYDISVPGVATPFANTTAKILFGGWRGANKFFGINSGSTAGNWVQQEFVYAVDFARKYVPTHFFGTAAWRRRKSRNND